MAKKEETKKTDTKKSTAEKATAEKATAEKSTTAKASGSTAKSFERLLAAQIRNEFAASHQYVGIGVWADSRDLPQLAKQFYDHSLAERNHAMMMVQYMLDRGIEFEFSDVPTPANSFSEPLDALEFALKQEREVTEQIEALFAAARRENDALGEQFILWFLREQIEEVANAASLVTIAKRAGNDWFRIEEYLARETAGSQNTSTPPATAGGAI